MSLVEHWADYEDYYPKQDCFMCGEALKPPVIFWWGATGYISLHPSCALSFMVRIGRDVWQYKHNTGRDVAFKPSDE